MQAHAEQQFVHKSHPNEIPSTQDASPRHHLCRPRPGRHRSGSLWQRGSIPGQMRLDMLQL